MPEIARDTLVDGRYKVVSRLGTGGMADVFLVEDQLLGRKVALKLLHRRFSEDPAFVERFRREAQAAAGMQHQSIVGIYDRGEFDGTYYIAMEYVPGRTLKEIIQQEAPLDPVRAIDIAIQILRAARFAHRRGIVHRDLKPHNVIVDDAGNAKVTDFGIARAGASDMTETGSIMGTAQYLSPEQAQGRSVTASSDLYSVGVVLYEMLTGRVPFDGEQAVTIALKHVSEAPVPPRELNPAVPPELDQTVMWTLNKNPADRPVDADQLITVLEHCRDAIVAGAAGQNTAAMTAVAAGAAAGMPINPAQPLPVVPTTAQPLTDGAMSTIPPENRDDEEGGGSGWRPWLLGLLVLALVCGAAAAAYFLTKPKQVLVPPVVGEQYSVARSALVAKGFQVSRVPQSSAKPVNSVVDESPGGGSSADKGSLVTLSVSTGQGKVVIPSVVGEPAAKAASALTAAGLTVAGTKAQSSTKVAKGDAVGTDPAGGTSVAHGTRVTLLVSGGTPTAAVPDVVGDAQATATNTLTAKGFKVNATYTTSSTVTAGDVISQNPGASATEPTGTTVTIDVAKAPGKVAVPPVTGDQVANAFTTLRGDGFVVQRSFKTVTNPAQVGIVLSQSPGSGTKLAKGATVSIVVGQSSGSGSLSGSSSSTSTTSTSSTTTSSSSTTP